MNIEATQSFFGSTPREALGAVKAALGDDAVIVDTREVVARGQRRYEVRVQAETPAQERGPSSLLSPPASAPTKPTTSSLDLDLHPTVARRLFERARRIENSGVSAMAAYEQALSELCTFTRAPWESTSSPRRTVAFVGPTGSGKTTTLAKTAAKALIEKKKIALITTDTWRVGAVQHLARYAEILAVPCYVASNDDELARALHHARGVDLVLIDTAGRSPSDGTDRLDAQRFRTMPQIETMLVVPASTTEKQLLKHKVRFAPFAPAGLVVSKVDEADGCGGAVGCSALLGLPLAALTDGQDVPDDIHKASLSDVMNGIGGAR